VTREDQRQQIFQLIALRDVDRLRSQASHLIDSVPRVLGARHRDSTGAHGALDAAKDKLKGFKTHLKSLELDLAEREAAILKANANLMSAKTNQEYSLLVAEIARKREEKGKVEEQILEQFETIKQGEGLVKSAEAHVVEAESEYKAFEDRAKSEWETHRSELAGLEERRAAIRRAIQAPILKLYDRALAAHGEGVGAVEANVCQGCFSTVTPNDRSRLISGLELVTCRSCQRILYLPEVLQASPAQ